MPCPRPQLAENHAGEVLLVGFTRQVSRETARCLHAWFRVRAWLKWTLILFLSCPTSWAVAAPDGVLTEAWEHSRLGEFSTALRLFQDVQNDNAATPKQKIEALFGQAHVWNYRTDGNDGEKARALYARVIKETSPTDPISSWSDYESVQALHLGTPYESRDYKVIAQRYLDLSQRQAGTPAGEEAYLTYLYIEQGVLDVPQQDVIKKCEAFIQSHPDSPWLSTLYIIMAASYDKLKQPRQRAECFIHSAEAAKKASAPNIMVDTSDSFWQVAYLAEFELGDFALAREYYGKLIKDYPNDVRVFSAKEALARMDAVEAAARQGRSVPLNPKAWSRPWIQP